MPMERRGRQNLNLATGTQATHRGDENEHKGTSVHADLFPNRWARIGLRKLDKQIGWKPDV